MTPTPPALEQRLVERYQEQLRHYERAGAILDHAENRGASAGSDLWVNDLHAILAEASAVDAAMAEDKAAWRRSGQKPGPELSSLLACLATRIARLGSVVQREVADLEARKGQLLPQVDAFIQQRRMLEAYGKYGDSHPHVAKTT